MEILTTVIVALVIGLVAYLIASIVPFLQRYKEIIGVVVFLLALLGGTTGL